MKYTEMTDQFNGGKNRKANDDDKDDKRKKKKSENAGGSGQLFEKSKINSDDSSN